MSQENVDLVRGMYDAGERVIALGRCHAKNKATGTVIDAQFAHFWTLENGKATRFQQYADTAQAAKAVGRP